MIRHGYKVFTHHLCSPIQGGTPLWDGTLPYTLPVVPLDTSADECAPGWNYAGDVETALYIAGLWPTGRPSRVFAVEASADAIERGTKRRASTLTVVHEIPEEEIAAAIRRQSRCFASHAARMADEQCAWRYALARPQRDVAAVTRGLTAALRARGLDWQLKEYANARAAWAAWAARDAWDAQAAWDAWDARAAWEARAALTVCYAAVNAWTTYSPECLTAGLREAYEHGLGIAIPTGPKVLGWVMDA